MNTEKLIEHTLWSLGRATFQDVADEITRSALHEVLRKSNAFLAVGFTPCEGEVWSGFTANYDVIHADVAELNPKQMVDWIVKKRAMGLLAMVHKLENALAASIEKHPGEKLCTAILKGEWLRETAVKDGGITLVYIDSTCAFVPRSKMLKKGKEAVA